MTVKAKVTDPQGYEVTLTEERWQHITEGHPEVEKLLDVLLATLEAPGLISQDAGNLKSICITG
ncbi:MAG: hypothetical protein NVS1B11_37350 [Terriglobales bacterium]